ncbi:glycosyltransferase family 2 protein [Paenibacillus phocaensis]|uniref:glycosyltransferase family 2 protein n=1 Tax=Paenibacillus phocaensis TaxID=1776378 RepID=UPI000AF9EC40|nr:glycosyltransferase family 2 protein [Paenibacillus phocaensis]
METKQSIKQRQKRKSKRLAGPRGSAGRPRTKNGIARKGRRLARTSTGKGEARGPLQRLKSKALAAGARAAAAQDEAETDSPHMQACFREWARTERVDQMSFTAILAASLAYRRGYAGAAGLRAPWIPLPLHGSASAIVTASNEEKTLPLVIAELRKLPLQEIIVVLNGCDDGSFAAVDRDPRIMRLSFPERLGHDVGRAIGAAAATGDILLFTDGDLCVAAEDLAVFLLAIDRGDDLALNDLSPHLPPFSQQDEVTRCKAFLNLALGRPDLKANSLTAVPNALSRHALRTVGTAALIVPPKAQAMALARGLKAGAPISVDVIRKNRIRTSNSGAGNAVAQMIIGDHLEALGEVMQTEGVRLRFSTLGRGELAKMRNAR